MATFSGVDSIRLTNSVSPAHKTLKAPPTFVNFPLLKAGSTISSSWPAIALKLPRALTAKTSNVVSEAKKIADPIVVIDTYDSFTYNLCQAFRWRPVARKVFPENLPADVELPGVDVFICTADPTKEPTIEVMNTVVSAMALDYPSDKLSVYLSDDGGAASTLYAIKEACLFAKTWLPFCREYGVKTRCPEAYFSKYGDDERVSRSDSFMAEEAKIKSAYELFKVNVEKAALKDSTVHDRSAYVEVIHDANSKDNDSDGDNNKMPLLGFCNLIISR